MGDFEIPEVAWREGTRVEKDTVSSRQQAVVKLFGTGPVGNRFAVTADGQRFLIPESAQTDEGDQPEITLVLNWDAGIK